MTSLSFPTHTLHTSFFEVTHCWIFSPGSSNGPFGRMSKFGGLTNLISFIFMSLDRKAGLVVAPGERQIIIEEFINLHKSS